MPSQPLAAPNLKPSLSGKTEAISMGGGTVPFLDPSQPYKYLGVHVSLSMDWETQIQAVINEAVRKGRLLEVSWVSRRQCLEAIKYLIKPGMSHHHRWQAAHCDRHIRSRRRHRRRR